MLGLSLGREYKDRVSSGGSQAIDTFMNYPGIGSAYNEESNTAPTSNLNDYVFTLESSAGLAFYTPTDYSTLPDGKIHISNVSNISSITSFSWTPPSSVCPDFMAPNEILVYGNDIYIVYRWSGWGLPYISKYFYDEQYPTSNYTLLSSAYAADGSHQVSDGGYVEYIQTSNSVTRKIPTNKLIKLTNVSVDEVNQQLTYTASEDIVLPFVNSIHGNAVSDGHWVLTTRGENRGNGGYFVCVPLDGSAISNYKFVNSNPLVSETTSTALVNSTNGHTGAGGSVAFGRMSDSMTKGNMRPVIGGNDSLGGGNKYIYFTGGYYFKPADSGYSGSALPFLGSPGQNLVRAICRFDVSEETAEVLFPTKGLDYDFNTGLYTTIDMITVHDNFVICVERYGSNGWIYKYNTDNNKDLEVRYFSSYPTTSTNWTNSLNEDWVDATYTTENLYAELSVEYPSLIHSSGYVNMGAGHAVVADGTYIYVTSSASNGLTMKFDFNTLDYVESVVQPGVVMDDLTISSNNNYLFIATETGSSSDTYYISKSNFSQGYQALGLTNVGAVMYAVATPFNGSF